MTFFKQTAFALDISDSSIEALELKKTAGKIKLAAYGRIELEPGIVQDGIVKNEVKLAEHVLHVMKSAEPSPITSRHVIVSLPESRTLTHVFQFPKELSPEKIADAISYEAEKIIPFTRDEVYFDFQIIKADDEQQEIFYAATAKDVVDRYRRVLSTAGLLPIAFDMESAALARSLAPNLFLEGVVLIDLGARTTIVSIFDHNGIRQTVNIPIAGDHITSTIAKKLKTNEIKAESLKRSVGLNEAAEDKKALAAIQSSVDSIASEVKKILNDYKKKTGFLISRAILCGGTSLLPNMDRYLAQKLSLKTERGNPLGLIPSAETILTHQPPILYATVIGLAVRALEKKSMSAGVNLAPVETGKEPKPKEPEQTIKQAKTGNKKNKRLLVFTIVFVALLLALVGLLFFRDNLFQKNVNYVGVYSANTNSQASTRVVLTAGTKTESTADLPGSVRKQDQQEEGTFTATGTRPTKAQAAGTVTLYNETAQSQTLVASTRLQTADGILYRLRNLTVVPAQGNVDAEMYADKPGEEYEVAASDFTIPGLPESTQKVIYGKSTAPTTGGLKEVHVVTQSDVEEALDALKIKAAAAALSTVNNGLSAEEVAIVDPLKQEVTDGKFSPTVDEEGETFTAKATIQSSFLILKKADVLEALKKKNSALQLTNLDDVTFAVTKYDDATGTVTIDVTIDSSSS